MCAVRWGPAHSLRVGVCLPRHHWPDFLLHSPFELAMTVCGLFLGFAVCSVRPPIDDRVQKLACPWSTGVRPAAAHASTDWDAGSGESPAGPLGPAAQAPHLRTRLLLGVFRLWCPLVSRLLRRPARVAAASQPPWSQVSGATLRRQSAHLVGVFLFSRSSGHSTRTAGVRLLRT